MKKLFLLSFFFLSLCLIKSPGMKASDIEHVNPPSWWVGMKLPLQLMVNGPDISSYDVSIKDGDGVKVTGIHKAESPNYLFIDIDIPPTAKAGTYNLVFTKDGKSFEYPYEIAARRPDSSNRGSFTTADLIYLIMPDRFANGDTTNDSTDDTTEKANRNSLGGRHGGDLQGIINNLDYISDLGATAIWNTPLLLDDDPRGSYHGYAASDYYLIDPRFGDNELFKEFVGKAHEKDLKVIMDVVTNHSGTHTYWWSEDLPFQDWIHQFPEYTGSNHANSAILDTNASNLDRTLAEEGWFTPGMADMNLNNPYLLQFFKQWALWWIEFADLDGYRVDTYWYNEKEPMSQWNQAILDEYPNFNIVGETWISQIPAIAYWQKDNNNHDGFNSNLPSVMDFPLLNAANKAFGKPDGEVENNEGQRGHHKNGARELYDVISQDYIYPNINNLLVFTSNHDTDRVGDIVGKDPDRFKAMMVLFATVRGIPQIFSGDEMMFSSVDPKTGHPGLRVDFPGGWEGDTFDFFTDEGRAAADVDFNGEPIKKGMRKELYDFSKNLFQWRKNSDVIHNGKTKHFIPTNDGYGYFRYNDNGTVFVFINTSDTETINVPWSHYSEISSGLGEGTNVLTGEKVTISDDTQVGPMGVLVVEY
ncbi:MAG: cyclomaltodextrinase N-terminal domain-containing protein [Muribaculaceae bacterium]|nr:cyclomaltodextrinase N-terminal domain-containing protein [Muribaculaceae bacterium]